MFKYTIKRLLLFLPTLLVITVFTFFLSKMTPGDPVLDNAIFEISHEEYLRTASSMHLDLPEFYWTFTSEAFPDTFSRIVRPYQRETLTQLIREFGNWLVIEDYYFSLLHLKQKVESLDQNDIKKSAIDLLKRQLTMSSAPEIQKNLDALSFLKREQSLGNVTSELQFKFDLIKLNAKPWKRFIPKITWNGLNNQYHIWLSNFLSGNFGKSRITGQEVSNRVFDALFWTFIINVCVIFLVFSLSVPLGVYSAVKRGSKLDKRINLLFFLLYSIPVFWLATMIIVFFTTPEYGMNWFPSVGLGNLRSDAPFLNRFWERLTHLLLPVLCLTLPSLAFVTRQMRSSMDNALKQDFILTARAKGLPEKVVIWKHAFRNSLLPIITLIASVFPATITGSVAIEYVFNIPGMGKLMVDSILLNDWPIVFAVLIIGSVLTLVGLLFADVLYAKADPRISF